MGMIFAIGGGEIGRPGYPIETTALDREMIQLTGKKKPRILFLPTASGDSEEYVAVVQEHFGGRLGCEVDWLYLMKENPSYREIQEKVFSADIVYVGGGNTAKMMRIWRRKGVDELLKKAHKRDIVLSGLSAGSICWFREGHSDSRKINGKKGEYSKVRGLGLIPAIHCPHYDIEIARRPHLRSMMQKTSGVAIAIDNCCALEVVNEEYRIISARKGAHAYKVYWKQGDFFEEKIPESKKFTSLLELLQK